MVKIRFRNEEDRTRGVIGLAKRMTVVGLRGGYYVVPFSALAMLDEWACSYEVVEQGGDVTTIGPIQT